MYRHQDHRRDFPFWTRPASPSPPASSSPFVLLRNRILPRVGKGTRGSPQPHAKIRGQTTSNRNTNAPHPRTRQHANLTKHTKVREARFAPSDFCDRAGRVASLVVSAARLPLRAREVLRIRQRRARGGPHPAQRSLPDDPTRWSNTR